MLHQIVAALAELDIDVDVLDMEGKQVVEPEEFLAQLLDKGEINIEFHNTTLEIFRALGDLKCSWSFGGSAHYGPSDQDGWRVFYPQSKFIEVHIRHLDEYVIFEYDNNFKLKHVLTEDG